MESIMIMRQSLIISLSCIFFVAYASENRPTVREIEFGIAACPRTAEYDDIAYLARQELDYIEMKTISDHESKGHDAPSMVRLETNRAQSWVDINNTMYPSEGPIYTNQPITLANSVGMPSPSLEHIKKTVTRTLELIRKEDLPTKLIFSIHGSTLLGFARMAQLARELQVPYVSINLSCPNINGGLLYKDSLAVKRIIRTVKEQIDTIPLIVKVGFFMPEERQILRNIVKMCVAYQVYALFGINTIPMKIMNSDGTPTFGPDREIAGVSGAFIKPYLRYFVRTIHRMIKKNNLPLRIFASGGLFTADDFQTLINDGADVLFCATAFVANRKFDPKAKYMLHSKL